MTARICPRTGEMASANCHLAALRIHWDLATRSCLSEIPCSGFIFSYFFAGAFFANFVPHFVSGVLGRTFPTPFASPPFRGLSSSRVNVLYGLCNLAVAYALLSSVGDFEPRSALHAGPFGLGLTVWSLMITRSLAHLQGGQV